MSQINHTILTALFLLTALSLGGCGSGNKEGATQGGNPLFGGVPTIGDSACIQCHSSVTEALTGQTLVSQYLQNSPHNQPGLGCESCHGGGAGHNGIGPIPYPLDGLTPTQEAQRCATCHNGVTTLVVNGVATVAPATNSFTDFSSSKHAKDTPAHTHDLCIRCHTNEGAVLSDISGFTGDSTVLTNSAYGPPVWGNGFTAFNCETCHQHGGGFRVVNARNPSGDLVLWDPAVNRATNQFDLCTSCHNMYNYNKTAVIGSGSAASGTLTFVGSGPHPSVDIWEALLTTTHREKGMATLLHLPFANMTTDTKGTWITGYVIRLTNTTDPYYRGPCYDCHGHEAKTDTGTPVLFPTNSTIYTDWAQSAHAGGVLTAKYAAAALSGSTVDSITQAYVNNTSTFPVWSDENWDDNATNSACQMCHTATGISNYLVDQTTSLTGYNPANNNFSHLIGWTAATGSTRQNELLYCWGCHKDAGTGALRNTTQAILSFTNASSQAIVITGAGNSTACVVCHGGRGSLGANIANDTRSSRFVGHHAPTAGVLYSAQTHIGYEYPGANYANPSFFVHNVIGLNGDGPCASCHMGPSTSDGRPSHTYEPVVKNVSGSVTAITNQALCNTCHTPGTPFAMTPAVLNEDSAGYNEATTILNNWLGNVVYKNYLNLAITSSNATDTATVPENAYGAWQNAQFDTPSDEPCAFVHNSFYIKRLIFDSIDWMSHGALTGQISIDAATYPDAAAWFGAPAGTSSTYIASRP